MFWFNIVLVLFCQSFLFFYISRMYGKHNKWFTMFSAFFLLLALINVVVASLMVIVITGDAWIDKFAYFGEILFYIQIGFFVIIVFAYFLKLVLDAVEVTNNAIKK